jgi:hypothetical protein
MKHTPLAPFYEHRKFFLRYRSEVTAMCDLPTYTPVG